MALVSPWGTLALPSSPGAAPLSRAFANKNSLNLTFVSCSQLHFFQSGVVLPTGPPGWVVSPRASVSPVLSIPPSAPQRGCGLGPPPQARRRKKLGAAKEGGFLSIDVSPSPPAELMLQGSGGTRRAGPALSQWPHAPQGRTQLQLAPRDTAPDPIPAVP